MVSALLLSDFHVDLPEFSALDAAMFADEASCIARLLPLARLEPGVEQAVFVRALRYASAGREGSRHDHFDALLQSYGLDTQEGIALMALAEALLRIPDADTQDALIRDLLDHKAWRREHGLSWLVHAASRALLLTDLWIDHTPGRHWADQLARQLGEPVLRSAMKAAMKLMAGHFVAGETIAEALAAIDPQQRYSFDMLGEAAQTQADAERYYADYHAAIAAIGAQPDSRSGHARQSVSVKLSALHPRYEFAQMARVMDELYPRLLSLAQAAASADLGLSIDAEEAERLVPSLALFARLVREPSLRGWHGLGMVVQAYQKRAPALIDGLAALASSCGRQIPVRLVKGAYWDSEVKRAQQQGWPDYPVLTRKAHTDVAYLACAHKLLHASALLYPQFASHNAQTLAWIVELTRKMGITQFEIQRLHGMGEALHQHLVQHEGIASRVYAPVGRFNALLPYLVRRLLENGANASFVHQLADARVALENIAQHPCDHIDPHAITPGLAKPAATFAPRQQAVALCIADSVALRDLRQALAALPARRYTAAPLIGGVRYEGLAQRRYAPADGQRELGAVIASDGQAMRLALNTAEHGWLSWQQTPVAQRCARLEAMALLLESHQAEMIYLLMNEAGKTLADAVGEWREAVDYCRYYAEQADQLFGSSTALPAITGEANTQHFAGRGIFICIAPWNFPLAIFLGQIVAALVAGNAVIAKPSRRTPLIAMRCAELLLQAGVPPSAISFLPGESGTLSARLLADPRIAGVAFTGSHAAAQQINRQLAARDGPIATLIAETGGVNAMIADSSAHLEALVNDVMVGAFNAGGQRCSALRLLLVQADIADAVIARLGAMLRELQIGDPRDLATDIGPLIDAAAVTAMEAYCHHLARHGQLVGQATLPDGCAAGSFFAPRAYEISLDALPRREAFGPVLHIARFAAGGIDDALRRIHALGYGLTLGVHTRLESVVELVRQQARVGNVYINRHQIGATVGAQPFGGEGLSGTGFKAGGPNYLLRFAVERTLTINTAATGGNVSLLMHGK